MMKISKSYKVQKINQLVRAATDEIYGSVLDFATGNYWINERWNIFCEKGYSMSGGEVIETYYAVSLEKYDDKGDCIDCQVDYQDTKDMAGNKLEEAIRKIVERNVHRWTDN